MASKSSKTDELVEKLKKRIEQGYYSIDQKLPSEYELAEDLNYSRNTVRNAMIRLQGEQIVDIIPRSGTYIRHNKKAILGVPVLEAQELKRAGSFILAMKEQGINTKVDFIEPSSIIKTDENLSQKLQVNLKTEVLRRYRLHSAEKVIYRVMDSYYLASLLGGLLGKDKKYIPLFKWLYEHKGVYANKANEKLNIRMPSEEEATLLKISRLQPVVDMDRFVWTNKGELFEYTRIIANASLHEYNYNYDIDEEVSK
ncbi:MAG: GntR family transcriptional regulator [Clostridiales bacterium]